MGTHRRVVLQLEVIISDQRPIAGVMRSRDGLARAFSGWSELFAVLQAVTSVPGGDNGTEEHR
ncbi:MAG: hypothetical protein JOY82_12245 [Streptosporangiaceae bacterium]|nr:hypothetical protein [Streptosporangiaceae bacterium]MBV9855268.1 hypothetical protein [Streptosporangiaceae bacterium]